MKLSHLALEEVTDHEMNHISGALSGRFDNYSSDTDKLPVRIARTWQFSTYFELLQDFKEVPSAQRVFFKAYGHDNKYSIGNLNSRTIKRVAKEASVADCVELQIKDPAYDAKFEEQDQWKNSIRLKFRKHDNRIILQEFNMTKDYWSLFDTSNVRSLFVPRVFGSIDLRKGVATMNRMGRPTGYTVGGNR